MAPHGGAVPTIVPEPPCPGPRRAPEATVAGMDVAERSEPPKRRSLAVALVALVAAGALAGCTFPDAGSDENGTLAFQDTDDGEALQAAGPGEDPIALECQFRVRGQDMRHANGTILAQHETDGTAHVHAVANWTGTDNGSGGWNFETGPITLHASGEWRIQATSGPGRDNLTRAHRVAYTACGSDPANPDCAPNLRADPQTDGDVELTWTASANASTYHVYRASETGPFQRVASTTDTAYTDTGTDERTPYRYAVTTTDEAAARACPTAAVTTLAFLQHAGLVALAGFAGVSVFLAIRRA